MNQKWKNSVINVQRTPLNSSKIKTAILLHQNNQIAEASRIYLDILHDEPSHVEALHLLGVISFQQDNIDQAIELIHKAITITPNYTAAQNNLGLAFRAKGRLEDAMNAFENTIKLDPNHPKVLNNLGVVFMSQGKLKDAMATFRDGLKMSPDCMIHQNLIFCMNYDPQISQKEILEESKRWCEIYSVTLDEVKHSPSNDIDYERPLHIGYVSSDFCEHSVSYFFDSVITEHDRDLFKVFCYSNVTVPDNKTEYFENLSDGWCSIVGMTDAEVDERIREDEIDILIDLAGHTAGNRLTIFIGRPAPIQVSWIGYLNTTGVPSIDYRFTDDIADPKGEADKLYSETLIRLPKKHFCYTPSPVAPDVDKLPALTNEYITFGSFNDLMKITPEVVEIWSSILNDIPKSKLLLKNRSLADEKTRHRYLDMFMEHGINNERIILYSWSKSKIEHFELYNKVDIGLDTFPYNGVTTTCEAMWMGVPVIALRGDRHCGRCAASILTQVNLLDFIAESADEYVKIAVTMAADLETLSTLRNDMRSLMRESPLFDSKGLMRDVESAYRDMWRKYHE